MVLQMVTTTLVGTPAYLFGLHQLGKFAGHLSLDRIHVSLKTRTLLLAGLVPALSYSLLVHYHWLHTGQLEPGFLITWAALGVITATISLLSIRSTQQALAPFQNLFSRSGASTHEELAQLRPASTDEIGHLTQTLGKVFQRLGDQETHMRAIVDTAAEGIIVVDEKGLIDTFNPAAERLFGYLAQEIRGRHLASLLPEYLKSESASTQHREEREVEGHAPQWHQRFNVRCASPPWKSAANACLPAWLRTSASARCRKRTAGCRIPLPCTGGNSPRPGMERGSEGLLELPECCLTNDLRSGTRRHDRQAGHRVLCTG